MGLGGIPPARSSWDPPGRPAPGQAAHAGPVKSQQAAHYGPSAVRVRDTGSPGSAAGLSSPQSNYPSPRPGIKNLPVTVSVPP